MVIVLAAALLLATTIGKARGRLPALLLSLLLLVGHVARADTVLGTSTGSAKVVGELGASGTAKWTPVRAATAPLAWFDTSLSTLAPAVNGTGVATATDARTGAALFAQSTSGLRFTYSTSVTAGAAAYPSIAGTKAASSAFGNTTVGLGGTDTDWTVYVVGAFDSTNPYVLSDGPIAIIGNGSGHQLLIGTNNAAVGWSVVGVGAGAQIASAPVWAHDSSDQDFYIHLFCADHRASDGRTRMFVDGALVATGNSAYSLAAGLGFGNLTPFSLRADTHQWAILLRAGVDSDALRHLHESYFARRYQLLIVFGLGDSLIFGHSVNGLSAPGVGDPISKWLPPRIRVLGCSHWNMGVSGQRSDQILARASSVTALASGVTGIVLLNGGTNDAFEQGTNGVPTATADAVAWCIANQQATATALRAAGLKVLLYQMLPVGTSGSKPATFDAFQALHTTLTTGATWVDGVIPVPASLSNPNDATQYDSDSIHLVYASAGHGYDLYAAAAVPPIKAIVGLQAVPPVGVVIPLIAWAERRRRRQAVANDNARLKAA